MFILPLADPLARYLVELPSADDNDAPVFPSAHGILKATGRVGTLSNQFHELMVVAGLAAKKSHKKTKDGQGPSAKRQQNELVFHCLRHTATSLLKNAGVSDAITMDMIGHNSRAV